MKFSRMAAAALMLGVTACGGGGSSGGNGGGGGGGGTANRPPTFTSGTSFSIEETNLPGPPRVIVQLSATDLDGDSLTFSIAPGKDSALFQFSGTQGALSFAEEPSFETALDTNGDNIYELDVRVSDGTATVTQTIQVQVTNSLEGLVVTTLAGGLGNNGALAYLDDINEVLVVDEDGNISRVAAATGATTRSPLPANIVPGAKVIDIMADDFGSRGGNFFLLANNGSKLFLHYVDSANGDSTLLWLYDAPAPVTGSLGRRGDRLLVAISDAGSPDAAQDPNDPRGNILEMVASGDPKVRAGYSVTPLVAAWGLHDPRLPVADNIQAWPIDRGVSFNEINQADFPISQRNANFEWPIRDGLSDVGFSGVVSGVRVAPRITQEIGTNGAGRWLSAAESLQGNGWFGVWVIGDDAGNFWTWDAVNDGPLENRNLDFGIGQPFASRAIVSMDDGDSDQGNARPIYMLRADGNLLVADLQP